MGMTPPNPPTAGPSAQFNREGTGSGRFAATLFGEGATASMNRGGNISFPAPSPEYRSLNHVPPGLLDRTPAPLSSQTFRDGRPITDSTSFPTAFDERFRVLDSYESLFGPFERSFRHISTRNLTLAGVDPAAVFQQVDLRHTEIHTAADNEHRVRAWIGVSPDQGGMRIPPSAEYPIEDQRLGQLAVNFDKEDLYHAEQLRESFRAGKVAPWSILSPTDEQISHIDQRTSGASTAATMTGIAHTRLISIHEALDRIRDNRPTAVDWKLDVGMDVVNERLRQIAQLDALKNRRLNAIGVEVHQILEEESILFAKYSETSRKVREILGLEEMKARDQMQKMAEANDDYQHYTWESGFPGSYGSAPRLPRGPR